MWLNTTAIIVQRIANMKSGIRAFLLTVLIAGYAIFNPPSFATDAALLPNGVQQFFDNSGNPLTV